MNVSLNYSGILYAGTGLTLTCRVILDPNVNGGEAVTILWNGPQPIPGDRYFVEGGGGSGELLETSGSGSVPDDGYFVMDGSSSGGLKLNMEASGSGDGFSVMDSSGSGEFHNIIYSSSLLISPLAEGDDGKYICHVTVSGGEYILKAMNSGNINIHVLGEIFLQLVLVFLKVY